MIIRCTILRTGGTEVTIDATKYHFKPLTDQPGAPHVAEVTEKSHISRLLSIAESYEFYAPDWDNEPVKPEEGDDEGEVDLAALAAAENALNLILEDPKAASLEEARIAYEHLTDEPAHGRAKQTTLARKVIEKASEEGIITPEDAGELLKTIED